MIATILGWIALPLVRYALITVASVGFLAFMRADARAPWEQKVASLEETIRQRDETLAAYAKEAESDEKKLAELDKAIEVMTHDAGKKGACVLSIAELDGLRKLAERD